MIRHWLDAMGDTNPVYLDQGLAPPAMAQVWTMQGLRRAAGQHPPVDDVMSALDEPASPAWWRPTASRPTTATRGWASA